MSCETLVWFAKSNKAYVTKLYLKKYKECSVREHTGLKITKSERQTLDFHSEIKMEFMQNSKRTTERQSAEGVHDVKAVNSGSMLKPH